MSICNRLSLNKYPNVCIQWKNQKMYNISYFFSFPKKSHCKQRENTINSSINKTKSRLLTLLLFLLPPGNDIQELIFIHRPKVLLRRDLVAINVGVRRRHSRGTFRGSRRLCLLRTRWPTSVKESVVHFTWGQWLKDVTIRDILSILLISCNS